MSAKAVGPTVNPVVKPVERQAAAPAAGAARFQKQFELAQTRRTAVDGYPGRRVVRAAAGLVPGVVLGDLSLTARARSTMRTAQWETVAGERAGDDSESGQVPAALTSPTTECGDSAPDAAHGPAASMDLRCFVDAVTAPDAESEREHRRRWLAEVLEVLGSAGVVDLRREGDQLIVDVQIARPEGLLHLRLAAGSPRAATLHVRGIAVERLSTDGPLQDLFKRLRRHCEPLTVEVQ